jgi:hypothetical protein
MKKKKGQRRRRENQQQEVLPGTINRAPPPLPPPPPPLPSKKMKLKLKNFPPPSTPVSFVWRRKSPRRTPSSSRLAAIDFARIA